MLKPPRPKPYRHWPYQVRCRATLCSTRSSMPACKRGFRGRQRGMGAHATMGALASPLKTEATCGTAAGRTTGSGCVWPPGSAPCWTHLPWTPPSRAAPRTNRPTAALRIEVTEQEGHGEVSVQGRCSVVMQAGRCRCNASGARCESAWAQAQGRGRHASWLTCISCRPVAPREPPSRPLRRMRWPNPLLCTVPAAGGAGSFWVGQPSLRASARAQVHVIAAARASQRRTATACSLPLRVLPVTAATAAAPTHGCNCCPMRNKCLDSSGSGGAPCRRWSLDSNTAEAWCWCGASGSGAGSAIRELPASPRPRASVMAQRVVGSDRE